MRATVLVGLDVAAHRHDEELRRLAAEHDEPAVVAYLQLGEPSLVAALGDLAAADVDEVVLVGVALGPTAPAASWLGRVAAHRAREHGPHPVVHVAHGIVREASARAVADAAAVTRPVRATAAPLESPAWERVPSHRHHVLVCRGPRCSARGGDDVAAGLDEALRERGLEDDDVLVTQTGCLFPCNHAPVVAVHPDDVWYGGVSAADASTLVEEHLVAGRRLDSHRLPRGR